MIVIVAVLVVRRVIIDDGRRFAMRAIRRFQRFQFTWTDFVEFDFTFRA